MANLRIEFSSRYTGYKLKKLLLPALLMGLLLMASCSTSTGVSAKSQIPGSSVSLKSWEDPGYSLYVADTSSNDVRVINLANFKTSRVLNAGPSPIALALTQDDRSLVVANNTGGQVGGTSTLTIIHLSNYAVSPQIQAGQGPYAVATIANPPLAFAADMGLMAIDPSKISKINLSHPSPKAVANAWIVKDAHTITPINTSTLTPLPPIYAGPGPGAIAIAPRRDLALVADSGTQANPGDSISIINLRTDSFVKEVVTGLAPQGVVVTPNEKYAYVTDSGWWEDPGRYVVPVDLSNLKTLPPIKTGIGPLGIAITPNGKWVYVANYAWQLYGNGTITPIDTSTNKPGKAFKVGPGPISITISPDGKFAYVALVGTLAKVGHSVVPIRLSDNKVGPPIEVGKGPSSVVVGPTIK